MKKRRKKRFLRTLLILIVLIAIGFGVYTYSNKLTLEFNNYNLEISQELKNEICESLENFDEENSEDYFVSDFDENDYISEYKFTYKKGFNSAENFSILLPYDTERLIIKREKDNKIKSCHLYGFGGEYLLVPEFIDKISEGLNSVEFIINSPEIEQGNIAYIKAKNVKHEPYLSFSAPDGEKIDYFKSGDDYIVIIPSDYSTEVGKNYVVSSYSNDRLLLENKEKIEYEIVPREFSTENLTISTDTVKEKRTEDARKEHNEAFEKVFNEEQYQYSGTVEDFMNSFVLPVSGILTTEYGVIRFINNNPSSYNHSGLDIARPTGTDVLSTADGKVVFADSLTLTGNTVVISHGFNIFSVYYHLNSLDCKKDDIIKAGDKIGEIGTTGFSTGPHLHFEITYNDTRLEAGFFIYGEAVTYDNYKELFERP